jgi:glycosyltransferase involved in cell wall biosynthesis
LFEGFGMTAVEMMGRGIPTIVANSTAMPEVTQGMCRYYEPTLSEDALATEILAEIENPTSKEQLEVIADKIKSIYSYDNIASQYWDLFKKCMK